MHQMYDIAYYEGKQFVKPSLDLRRGRAVACRQTGANRIRIDSPFLFGTIVTECRHDRLAPEPGGSEASRKPAP